MDTVVIAVRFALLIVTTGTFAAMWSGDQSEQIAAVDRSQKLLIGKSEINHVETFRRDPLSRDRSQLHFGVTRNSSHESQMLAPLPEGIVAGTYLIADQSGQTSLRIVQRHDVPRNFRDVSQIARNHYSIEVGRRRWHYVRINERDDNEVSEAGRVSALDRVN